MPDLPGCYSAGDTLDDAISNAKDAIAAWIDAVVDAGEAIPSHSSLDAIRTIPGVEGWIFTVVQIDPDS